MRQDIRFRAAAATARAPRLAGTPRAETHPEAAPTLSFATDIKPLFAPYVAAMNWRFDLGDYEAVKASASAIAQRIGQDMPPPPFPLLSLEQQALFHAWVKQGCPP